MEGEPYEELNCKSYDSTTRKVMYVTDISQLEGGKYSTKRKKVPNHTCINASLQYNQHTLHITPHIISQHNNIFLKFNKVFMSFTVAKCKLTKQAKCFYKHQLKTNRL